MRLPAPGESLLRARRHQEPKTMDCPTHIRPRRRRYTEKETGQFGAPAPRRRQRRLLEKENNNNKYLSRPRTRNDRRLHDALRAHLREPLHPAERHRRSRLLGARRQLLSTAAETTVLCEKKTGESRWSQASTTTAAARSSSRTKEGSNSREKRRHRTKGFLLTSPCRRRRLLTTWPSRRHSSNSVF